MTGNSSPVLFFDGVCNLCNRTVQFIIKHDKDEQFRFAPLQSVKGQAALKEVMTRHLLPPDSVILLYKDKYYTQSDAVLQTLKLLGGIWRLAQAGYIIPRVIRNRMYVWVSKNRYKWFGRKDKCMVPAPGLANRFLQ